MIGSYAFWKTLHVLAGSVVLGTGIGIAFFAWFGYRRAMAAADIGALRLLLRLTVLADACFTAPAIVVQIVSAAALLALLGWSPFSPWALGALSLYAVAAGCWLPVLALQVALRDEAQRAPSTAALSARFHRRFRLWFALGVPAFVAVVALFALMIAKPAWAPVA